MGNLNYLVQYKNIIKTATTAMAMITRTVGKLCHLHYLQVPSAFPYFFKVHIMQDLELITSNAAI